MQAALQPSPPILLPDSHPERSTVMALDVVGMAMAAAAAQLDTAPALQLITMETNNKSTAPALASSPTGVEVEGEVNSNRTPASSNSAAMQLAPLEAVPFDVLLEILAHLDLDSLYSTVLALASANSRLRASIFPDMLCPLEAKYIFYQRAERDFDQHHCRLACFTCWRFLDKDKFADCHRRGLRGKFSSNVAKQRTRCCWECGTKDGRWADDRPVRKGGKLWYFCGQCEEWKTKVDRCAKLPWGIICSEVMNLGEDATAPRKSRLERLPDDIFDKILGQTTYQARIFLAATNKRMRKRVGAPSVGHSILERARFLDQQLRLRRREDFLACYGCWRLKPRDGFSDIQQQLTDLDKSWYFGRRCQACLQLFYGQGKDTEAGQAAWLRFKRQGVCTRCRKMRYWDEECEGCLIDAERLAEKDRQAAVKRKQRGERDSREDAVDVLCAPDPGVADWLDTVGLSDEWPWVHNTRTVVVEEGDNDESENYPDIDFEGDILGGEFLAWTRLVGLSDAEEEGVLLVNDFNNQTSQQPSQPSQPPQTDNDTQSLSRGFEVWLLYNRLLGRTTSDASATEASTSQSAPTADPDPADVNAFPATVATASEATQEPARLTDAEEDAHSRHRRRFLSGEMTDAERSLYMRIHDFVDRQRKNRRHSSGEHIIHQRQRQQQQGRSSRILELVSQRLRGLGMRMVSRRTEMT